MFIYRESHVLYGRFGKQLRRGDELVVMPCKMNKKLNIFLFKNWFWYME